MLRGIHRPVKSKTLRYTSLLYVDWLSLSSLGTTKPTAQILSFYSNAVSRPEHSNISLGPLRTRICTTQVSGMPRCSYFKDPKPRSHEATGVFLRPVQLLRLKKRWSRSTKECFDIDKVSTYTPKMRRAFEKEGKQRTMNQKEDSSSTSWYKMRCGCSSAKWV